MKLGIKQSFALLDWLEKQFFSMNFGIFNVENREMQRKVDSLLKN